MATTTPTICRERERQLQSAKKGRYIRIGDQLDRGSKSDEKPDDYWSEWQDSNLRPLRPERSAYFLSY